MSLFSEIRRVIGSLFGADEQESTTGKEPKTIFCDQNGREYRYERGCRTYLDECCPKCGKLLGEGVTRCWATGCDYIVPGRSSNLPSQKNQSPTTSETDFSMRPATLIEPGNRLGPTGLDKELLRYLCEGHQSQKCRVCGFPAIPGSDLCYEHDRT